MSLLITAITVIGTLGVIILIHELGHFISAKYFGCRVEEFGMGMPPRICGIKKVDDKWKFFWRDNEPNPKDIDSIIYSLNFLPLGGFCKITGEDGTEKEKTKKDPKNFNSKKPWQRAVILLAGVSLNFLLGLLLLMVIFWMGSPPLIPGDHTYEYEKGDSEIKIADVAEDSPADKAGLKLGDLIISVDGKKFESDDELVDYIEVIDEDVAFKIKRWGKEIEFKFSPRDSEHRYLYTGDDIKYKDEEYYLEAGDLILGVNGENFDDREELQKLIDKSDDDEASLYIKKGNSFYIVEVDKSIQIEPEDLILPPYWGIGFYRFESYKYPAWKVPYYAVKETGRFLVFLPKELYRQFSKFSGDPKDVPVTGPVGIAVYTKMAVSFGLLMVLSLMYNITLALAIFNALPIPALDGGRVLFILIEKIRGGKKIDPKWEQRINATSFIGLMLLAVLITYSDIIKFFF